jgi:hypothetical protein
MTALHSEPMVVRTQRKASQHSGAQREAKDESGSENARRRRTVTSDFSRDLCLTSPVDEQEGQGEDGAGEIDRAEAVHSERSGQHRVDHQRHRRRHEL